MTGTTWALIGLAAVSGALYIRAEYAGARPQVYALKPLTTGLILLMALLLEPATSAPYKALIAGGLLFSLAGDVFLILPSDRFVAGLASFLVAHLFYIAAFVVRSGFHADGMALALYAVAGASVLLALWPHLGHMRGPVLGYMAVILAMGWQALGQWRAAPSASRLSAAVGAALFVLSDAVLALDRFRGRIAAGPLVVLGAYYLAQALIALSILP